MSGSVDIVVTRSERPYRTREAEICEHKGIGHPDSLCDGAAEAVSLALNRAYRQAYGGIRHYNVDKALLVGGESRPRFGGGQLLTPMRLILCGRATELPGGGLRGLVEDAAREYLATHLRVDPAGFQIECAVRGGSPNLQQTVEHGAGQALANDTSFGVGFAPYTPLEAQVLRLAARLRSPEFRRRFPAAGDDYKLMGFRAGDVERYTIALALVDRHVHSVADYFAIKTAIAEDLRAALDRSGELVVNALDDPAASDETGLYLTVTGLSAEQGDDGQVGRGNRMNGLITPGRSMSLEAVAGKNPVAHVGKLYNALAWDVARALVAQVKGVEEASVQILSRIGQRVDRPALVAVELGCPDELDDSLRRRVRAVVEAQLSAIAALSARLADGGYPAF